MIFESYGALFFPDRCRASSVRFPVNSISLNDPIIKALEYGMVAYLIEILDLKHPFFSRLSFNNACLKESIKFSHLLMV